MNREGSPNVPAEVSISFGLIFLSKPSLLSAGVATTFISVFTIPTPSLEGFSVCGVDEFAVGDAGGLEEREFSTTSVLAHPATVWSNSSGHGFWACDGVDIAIRSMLDVIELVCVNALGEANRSVATAHKLLGKGEKL
jgi:hypothetical protein